MSKQSVMKTNMFSSLLWLILLFWWRETLKPFRKSKWPSRYKSGWPSVTGYFDDHIMSLSEGLMDCELLSWCRVIMWLTIGETDVGIKHTHTQTQTILNYSIHCNQWQLMLFKSGEAMENDLVYSHLHCCFQ